MATLNIPKGLTPNRKLGGGYNSGGMTNYPIANAYAANIGEGDPVKLSAGVIQLADNESKVLGVFAGCKYIDSQSQLRIEKNFIAGTSSKGGVEIEGSGYKQPIALVIDDANQTYTVQTTEVSGGQVERADLLGKSFRMTAIGSVVNGRSQAILDVEATVGVSAGDGYMVTVLGLYKEPDVEFGTYPIALEVKLANPGIVGEL